MYVVKYTGKFGFIKPWTAVRDASGGETYSQQFLTPSIIEGMRQKLGVTTILRHKLRYKAISVQQEAITGKTWKIQGGKKKSYINEFSILKRGLLLDPELWLAFATFEDAQKAASQHLCMCRNEDILLPQVGIEDMDESEFNQLNGFELISDIENENNILVGYNRFDNGNPMYGYIEITGNPINHQKFSSNE